MNKIGVVTVLALFGVSLVVRGTIGYAGEPANSAFSACGANACNYKTKETDCHAHYRKGYRVKHCTPTSQLAEHFQQDPIYRVHDAGPNDFREAISASEKFKLEQRPIETEPVIETKKYRIEIEIVPIIVPQQGTLNEPRKVDVSRRPTI